MQALDEDPHLSKQYVPHAALAGVLAIILPKRRLAFKSNGSRQIVNPVHKYAPSFSFLELS